VGGAGAGRRNGIRVHLGERDCSVQGRPPEARRGVPRVSFSGEDGAPASTGPPSRSHAVTRLRRHGEFLVARDGSFYSIEMNTPDPGRAPGDECSPGWTSWREQIRNRRREPLGYKQDAVDSSGTRSSAGSMRGSRDLRPSPGLRDGLGTAGRPQRPGDSHLRAGYTVPRTTIPSWP